MKRKLLATLTGLAIALGSTATYAGTTPSPSLATPDTPPQQETSSALDLPDVTESVIQQTPATRNGREIFAKFKDGLADPICAAGSGDPKWEAHFSQAPLRLADPDQDLLPLFGYVVDQLRAKDMPSEFALIPFIESGYRPDIRSRRGPAGMWQFVPVTARNHHLQISRGYDGRLSTVDSTRAAVRYLRTLYGMFGGDWRLAVMAYNAGEYRILQAMRRAGMNAMNAKPAELPGLSPITYQYVDKLHALACVLDKADADGRLAGLDREVPILEATDLPKGMSLQSFAQRLDIDPTLASELNPALSATATNRRTKRQVLLPSVPDSAALAIAQPGTPDHPALDIAHSDLTASNGPSAGSTPDDDAPRTHVVHRGESAWSIARHYGITVKALLSRNGLSNDSVLKPGMVLAFDP